MLTNLSMGKKIYYGFVGLLIVSGIVAMIIFGIKPRPIPKIKLSGFDTTEKFVEAIQTSLYQPLKEGHLLFLGTEGSTENQIKAWKHFIKFVGYEELVIQGNQFPTPEEIQNLISQNKKIAMIMNSVDSSQVLANNAVFYYKKAGVTPMSFSFVSIPRSREEEKDMMIPCMVAEGDVSGSGKLGCLAVQEARMNYRKKVKPGQWAGIMNQTGGLDYTLMISLKPEVAN